MEEQTKKNNYLPIAIAVVVLVVVVGLGIFLFKGQSPVIKEEQVVNKPENQSPTGGQTTNSSKYKDGQYQVVGNYSTHATQEHINVSVTLKDGKIVASTVVSETTNPTSTRMQADFIAHYKTQVEGKNIDDVNLTKVSGSSLTPKGFNNAIEKIKAEAKV